MPHKMGRGTDNGHTLFARPELVPRNSEIVNRTFKKVLALRVASLECGTREAISKVIKNIKLTAQKLSLQSVPGIELQKNHKENHRLMVPERTTNKCLKFVRVIW